MKSTPLLKIKDGKTTKKQRELRAELLAKIDKLLTGKYKNVPILVIHNLDITFKKLSKGQIAMDISDGDHFYYITWTKFTNGYTKLK